MELHDVSAAGLAVDGSDPILEKRLPESDGVVDEAEGGERVDAAVDLECGRAGLNGRSRVSGRESGESDSDNLFEQQLRKIRPPNTAKSYQYLAHVVGILRFICAQ